MTNNNGNVNQTKPGKRGNILDELLNFNYNPANIESWIRVGCQVTAVGMAIVLVKGLDGDVCGSRPNLWTPSSWMSPIGCFVRGLVKNVPNDFNQYDGAITPTETNPAIVAPPYTFAPEPLAPTTAP